MVLLWTVMECTWFRIRRGFCRVWAAMWTLQFQEKGPFLSYCWERLGVLSFLLLLLALKECSVNRERNLHPLTAAWRKAGSKAYTLYDSTQVTCSERDLQWEARLVGCQELGVVRVWTPRGSVKGTWGDDGAVFFYFILLYWLWWLYVSRFIELYTSHPKDPVLLYVN